MSLMNTPYDMYSLVLSVLLKHKHTWAFRVIRVIFYNDSVSGSLHHLTRQNSVRRQFIVTMFRKVDFTFLNQP